MDHIGLEQLAAVDGSGEGCDHLDGGDGESLAEGAYRQVHAGHRVQGPDRTHALPVQIDIGGLCQAEKGTGKNARQAGYTIGGKTGTSETTVPGEVVVSFMGFAPADDPQILVLLAYNTPARSAEGSSIGTTGTWISGGNMGAPRAGKLIGEILDYLGVEKEYTADEAALADCPAEA